VAGTLAIGTTLLALSLSTEPGDPLFYPLLLTVALVWTAGGLLSGPLHLGHIPFRGTLRRPVGTPIAIGLAAAAVFLAGGALVRLVPDLRTLVVQVLDHAREGNAGLVLALALANGAAEEVFFRGAVFAALAHRRVLRSTAIYALVTLATWNPMLVLAGALMGLLFGLQRRASGGILAPLLTHVTWSLALLLALPVVVGA